MKTSIQRLRQVFALEHNVLVMAGAVFLLLAGLFSWYQLLLLYQWTGGLLVALAMMRVNPRSENGSKS